MGTKIDFGKTALDYVIHREGFPPALLVRLKPYGVGIVGQRILDLGTGTGTLARQLAQVGAEVIGMDIAEPLLKQARALDIKAKVFVDYKLGKAENIPLQDETQDVIIAGQCWHWFNPEQAGSECFRVLRNGGTVVICHFDWLPLPGNVVEATENLILKHNPKWNMSGGSGIYPRWLEDLAKSGFVGMETFSFDLDIPYTHEHWCGRIRASAGVSASLNKESVHKFDKEHQKLLAKNFPQDPLLIPHRVWAVIARKSRSYK
ncbi:SAM-dependent methyltransferase [Photorhabdus luminescens]|uniref:class I SAM-dependent methyltransferase n=1 Tax=Photorhabdus luminescens TaxID=29488 RepID=UPI000B4D4857|nr:methyltransferase domain-containing protein [Photorhabdus luminescens]OWO79323.1 SAM-dependent methyltransferase [Photorhabdus luminescens]